MPNSVDSPRLEPVPVAARPDPADRSRDVQLAEAFDRQRVSLGWTIGVMVLLLGTLQFLGYMPQSTYWLGTLLAVLGVRALLGRAYARADARARASAHWRLLFIAGAAATGLSWGLGPLLLGQRADLPEALLLALVLVGVSAIAVSQMAAMLPATVAFVVLALGPTAGVLLVRGTELDRLGALAVAVAGAMLLLAGRGSHRIQAAQLSADLRLGQALADAQASAQRQAELARERQVELERLSTIVAGTRAGLAELELPAGRLRVNPRFAEMLGRSVESLEAMDPHRFGELFHEGDLPAFAADYQALMDAQRSEVDAVLRLRHSEGHWVWCQLRVRVLSRTATGEPTLVNGTYVDITERLEAEHRWRSRAELSADWFWETDPQFRVTLLSDGVRFGLPIPHALLLGRTLAEVPQLRPLDSGWQPLVSALAAHRPFSDFALAIDVGSTPGEDAGRRLVELDGRPRFGGRGEFLGYEGVGRDVTERRRVTESLKESLALVDSLFEVMPIPVLMKDRNGRYLRANRSYRGLMQAADREVRHVQDISDQAAAAVHQSVDEALLSEPGIRRYEVQQTMDSGRVIHGVVHKATLVASDGSIRGLVATLIDITDERAAAAALQAARDAAEQANRAKSAFLATMSHELRTPLNAVIGAAQLLRTTQDLPGEREALLDAVEKSGLSLLGLVESVMDLSRIEASELRLADEPLDLVDCVDGAVATLSIAARDRGLRMAAIVAPELASLRRGDGPRLRQVLLNLLGNAIKFTPAGEIVLEVRAGPALQADGVDAAVADAAALVITVEDTGIGIEAGHLQSIFEPFQQVESGSARRYSGSGLGLAIVRELVHAMGGRVQVTSRPGQGSRFTLELRLPQVQTDAASPEAVHRLGGRPRVAIFEPHAASRRALECALTRLGFDPVGMDPNAPIDPTAPRPDWLLWSAEDDGPTEPPPGLWADWPTDRTVCIVDARRLPAAGLGAVSSLAPAADGRRRLIRPVSQSALAGALGVQGPAAAAFAAAASAPSLPLRLGRSPPMRLLLVEDDPTNQVITAGMLAHRGHAVVTVGDGLAALERLALESFDLVLMDCQLPGLDGLEVTRRIRGGAAGPDAARLPIVAVTANAFMEDRAACLAAGMDDFVSKPLRLEALLDTVARWTDPLRRPN